MRDWSAAWLVADVLKAWPKQFLSGVDNQSPEAQASKSAQAYGKTTLVLKYLNQHPIGECQ